MITVAMRSHNDQPLVAATLAGLARQSVPFRLLALDNASTDGTREAVAAVADQVIDIAAGEYVPGRVLNLAMQASESDVVVFLNADCVPQDEHWLAELVAPFAEAQVGATFGRQMPREDCAPLQAQDTEATFSDGAAQGAWRHCFSMASSAVRRRVWQALPFDEALRYSEDVAWSYAGRQAGAEIRYVPSSRVRHSHNYTAAAWRRRQYGEGRAEAVIFAWTAWQASVLRYSLLPLVRQVVRDVRYCLRAGRWSGLLYSPGYRWAQMRGRREGLRDGLRWDCQNEGCVKETV